jgi:YidC/Oxa1 family membrane protein insertase
MILANVLTSIIQPFANAFGWVLAGCYSFTHNFGLSIVLLTLAVMLVVFPLTRAGTRSMMRMQLLAPELQKIRNRYKMSPGMSPEERQAARLALNEEMMALYRENGVNPTGGCLPLLLQMPAFLILYNVIRGMTRQVPIPHSKALQLSPQYIPLHTQLYNAVIGSHGKLESFGLNLSDSVRTQGAFTTKLPYITVILIAVVLQYVAIWQITNRNPTASQTPQQMQTFQRIMPLFFVVIYIAVPAGVGIYFIISSLFRIGQQEYMYKHDKQIVASVQKLRERQVAVAAAKKAKPASASSAPKGFRERMREAANQLQGGGLDDTDEDTTPVTPKPSAAGPSTAKAAAKTSRSAAPKPRPQAQNRSRNKRRRRA